MRPNIASGLRRQLDALTGARFVAAINVVLYHFASRPAAKHYAPSFIVKFLKNGDTGVLFFFLLSGFILTYSYYGKLDGQAARHRFWQARFARIYPVYLLSLVLNWPFRGALTLGTTIAVLTATQTWNPWKQYLAEAWNYPAWTLSVEAFFYLCFPALLPLGLRISVTARRVVLAIFFALVCAGIQNASPLPWGAIPQFLIGMILALEFLENPMPSSNLRAVLSALLALVILCTVPEDWKSLLVIPYAWLIYELALGGNILARCFSSRPMLLLGGASYSVYLLQYPVRNWVRFAFDRWDPSHASIGALLTPLLLIVVSCVIFQYYEEPLRRALKGAFDRSFNARDSHPRLSSQTALEKPSATSEK
jgi:peptidoglycan/LPS O-acetylase OafA/YrhL